MLSTIETQYNQKFGWYKIQLKNTGEVGIGLFGTMMSNKGKRVARVICWLPSLGTLENVGEMHRSSQKNYIFCGPDDVYFITIPQDEVMETARQIW